MGTSSLQRFESDLFEVRNVFPNLQIKVRNGQKYLKGILDIKTNNGLIAKSYLIEIHYAPEYPHRFPRLFEVGGEIPNEPDYHKYTNGSCCLTVEPDEILKCQQGLSVTNFIKTEALPYFANQYYRKITGAYKKEFPHGRNGYLIYFTGLFGTENRYLWLQYLQCAFENKSLKIRNSNICICGSGKSFDKCHANVIAKLKSIGLENIIKYFKFFEI